MFLASQASGQTPDAPWFLDDSGTTTKLAHRDAGGGKPHSFADTDGLAGEEFTFVRKETGDYWTVNGGPRLGVNQTGNLTIRLDDGENTIRYYTNVPGIGYQTWYVVPPMAKVLGTGSSASRTPSGKRQPKAPKTHHSLAMRPKPSVPYVMVDDPYDNGTNDPVEFVAQDPYTYDNDDDEEELHAPLPGGDCDEREQSDDEPLRYPLSKTKKRFGTDE